MTTRWLFIKNAIANLSKGSAAGIVALLLPPLLVRHMTAAEYGAWVLVLQAAAYIGYLDFGLQTAIGRYVAYATEKLDYEQRNSVFSTAFAGLLAAALLSLVLLLGAVAAVRMVKFVVSASGKAVSCSIPISCPAWFQATAEGTNRFT